MEFSRIAWNVFAVAGIVATLYAVYRGALRFLQRGEDGPIRVKGGSVIVENKLGDWELDEEDGDREYHTKGQPTGWLVRIWRNEADLGSPPLATFTGRRVIVLCDPGSGGGADYRIVFRANGVARVVDQNHKLTHSGNILSNTTPAHRIKKVVVKTKGSPDQEHEFAADEKGYLKLLPQ